MEIYILAVVGFGAHDVEAFAYSSLERAKAAALHFQSGLYEREADNPSLVWRENADHMLYAFDDEVSFTVMRRVLDEPISGGPGATRPPVLHSSH